MGVVRARRPAVDLAGFAGALAVVVALALSVPGVRIARAADPASGVLSEGGGALATVDPLLVRQIEGPRLGTCSAGRQEVPTNVKVAQQLGVLIEREPRRLAELAPPTEADTGFVVLNGRGHNYPTRSIGD